MAILSKGSKPHNFELHNSLKLSFPKIRALYLNFTYCESFLESNPPDILPVCETNLEAKVTHRHSLAVYVNSYFHIYKFMPILIYDSDSLYFIQCFNSFSSTNHLFCLYAQFLMLFHLI